MGRLVTLICGAVSDATFFLTFLYAIGFLGNVWLPKSLDSGPTGPLGTALLTFWSTPTMTVTHLLFAAVTTAYILVAIQLEERDLMDAHPEYAADRSRVPMLVPTWPRRSTVANASL